MSSPESSPDQPAQTDQGPLSELVGLNPEELLARGMQSVRMTGGGSLTSWEPPTAEETARLFPNYTDIDLCGRGGMGAVYKAKQPALDRYVAIKLLPLEISVDRDFADRFVREARTMAKMNHPNIVSVFDFGKTSQGHLFFVMEYVEGTTLHQMIKTVGLQPTQALEIISRVCEALNYAHGEGVVHRDIKPANVLVDIKGRVKVTDFGLARLNSPTAEQWGQTMTGMVLGTPDYMAPEQKNGAHVDHRADIYSLGVMLYEMLCGKVPQGIFDPPSHRVPVDARVDQVVIRAMQQEPDRRYRNTGEMKTDVETIRSSLDLNPAFIVPKPASPHVPISQSPPAPPAPPAPILRTTAPAPPAPFAPRSVGQPAAPGAPAAAPKKNQTAIIAIAAAACVVVGVGIWAVKSRAPGSIPPPADIAKAPSAIAPEPKKFEPEKAEPVAPPKTPEPLVAATQNPVPSPAPEIHPPTPPEPVPTAIATPAAVPQTPPPEITSPTIAALPVGTPPPTPIVMPAPAARPPVEAVPEPVAPPPVTEWMVLAEQGDKLMQRRQRREAVSAFERALDAAEGTAPPLEIGRLCQKLATVQAAVMSSAEARGTLQRGLQALRKNKAAGPGASEQIRMIDEMESRVRALPRD